MKPRKEPPGSTVLGFAAGPRCLGCGRPSPPGAATAASCPACGLTAAAGPVTQPAAATDPRGRGSETSGQDDPFAEVLAHPALRERFEILGKVGQGGMGAIFEARDTRLKRRVALKLVLHATRDRIARFEKEGELLAALSHPRILTVYGAEVIGNVPVLVMELLQGRTLKADLLHAGWYEPARAVEVALEIMEGLAAAHARGIVHRDLKPENVLLLEPEGLKILDFGLAQQVENEPGGRGVIAGTPAYMSPEQCEGRATDARSDVYSLGVILFEMLTGRLPFTGTYPAEILLKHVNKEPPRLMPLVSGLPMDMERVILTALRKRPEERYRDVETMARALREVPVARRAGDAGQEEPTASRRVSTRSRAPGVRSRPEIEPAPADGAFPRRTLLQVAGAAAVLLVVASLGLWYLARARRGSLKDDAPMVLLRGGEFKMGSSRGRPDASPEHRVHVNAFWTDTHLVTNRLYRRFVEATGHRRAGGALPASMAGDDQPAVLVTWEDAAAYCRWAGKRLPTEAEWEYAARGGLAGKSYPWGDDPPDGRACFGLSVDSGAPMPVGKHEANGFGLYDMAGNALEWCQDWYDAGYYKITPARNPPGPSEGRSKVARGGSWCDPRELLTCSSRAGYAPARAYPFVGFRCVRSAP